MCFFCAKKRQLAVVCLLIWALPSLLCAKQRNEANPYSNTLVAAASNTPAPSVQQAETKGINDPRYPFTLYTLPRAVPIPLPLVRTIHTASIDFSTFSTSLLTSLDREGFATLLAYLNTVDIELMWKDHTGHRGTGTKYLKLFRINSWIKITATGALALAAVRDRQPEVLRKILVLAPEQAAAALHGHAAAAIDAELAGNALVDLLKQVNPENARRTARAGELLISLYIEYWVEGKVSALTMPLTKLVLAVARLMQNPDEPLTHKQKGMLLGIMLAGAMSYARTIKADNDRRLWIVNSISNLSWAASTFLNIIPIAGSVAAAIAGCVSIAAVSWAIVANRPGNRDFLPSIKEVEGQIEFSALDLAEARHDRSYVLDMLETLAWMRATLHLNGHVD